MKKLWLAFEERFLKVGLLLLLLAVPLYPKFPLFNVPGTYVAVRAEDFLIAALAAVWGIRLLRNPRPFFEDRLNQAILLFFAVGALSLLSGVFLTKTIIAHLGFLHWARRVEYLVAFFIAADTVRRERDVRLYGEALFVAAFFAFLYGLGQIYLNFPVISTQSEEFSKGLALYWTRGARLQSTFAGHYDLASFVVMVLPLSFAFFFAVRNVLGRALIFIAAAASFWLLLASASRIAIPAYFLSLFIVFFFLNKKRYILPVAAISLIFVFTSGGVLSRYEDVWSVYITRYTGIKPIKLSDEQIESFKVTRDSTRKNIAFKVEEFKLRLTATPTPKPTPSPTPVPTPQEVATPQPAAAPLPAQTPVPVEAPTRKGSSQLEKEPEQPPVIEDRSTSIRTNVEWPRALRAFRKNPLLGTGYSSITLATDNDYLRLLGEIGLVGALAFLLVLATLTKRILSGLRKRTKRLSYSRAFLIGFLGGLAAILVNAVFIDVFEASKAATIFWALAGISVGAMKS